MRKKTYEEIKELIEINSSCKLITEKEYYSDTHGKIELKCECGDLFTTSYHTFKTSGKNKCNKCSLVLSGEKQKLDGIIVYDFFVKKNFTPQFKPNEYKRAKQRLPYICNKHKDMGIQYATYDNLQSGSIGCSACKTESIQDKWKLKHRKIVEQANCTYIDSEFVNDITYYILICGKHKEFGIQTINAQSFNKRKNCRFCGLESYSQKRKNGISTIINAFEMNDYIYDNTNTYTGNADPLKFICNAHAHIGAQITTYANLQRGRSGCSQCAKDKISKENHYLWKGGISPLHNYMRDKIEQWKKDSFKHYNYQCVVSGKKGSGLVVHHLYSYSNILNKVLEYLELPIYQIINEYTDTELKNIEEELIKKHYQIGFGVPVHTIIHAQFHSIYGKGDNTPDQFEEFKQNYNDGLYKDLTKEVS